MRLILAQLLLKFHFEICEESREWNKNQKKYFLSEPPPLKLRLSEKVVSTRLACQSWGQWLT